LIGDQIFVHPFFIKKCMHSNKRQKPVKKYELPWSCMKPIITARYFLSVKMQIIFVRGKS
jgi:hypothetical protein